MELPENPTSAQLLDQSVNFGLSAMEYILKMNSAEQKSGLTSNLKSVNKGLALLSKEWNPETAKLVQENLSTLKENADNPMYSEIVRSTLLDNWAYGNTAYDLLEEKEKMIADANQQVSSLYDEWSVLKRSEQSEAFTELLDTTVQNKVQLITNANDRAVGRISDDIKGLQEHLNAQNIAKKVDYDKERAGIQVDLNDMNAGHIKNIALELGFAEQETVDGVVTYQLPKDQYITEGGYDVAKEELEQITANLGAMSESQLDILATENPRVMKAIVEAALGKRSATDIKDLGFGPDQADKVAQLMTGHLKNIQAFNFQDKLSAWYKTAQTAIETGITEGVELESDVIKAQLNGLSDEAILYLNEKAYGVSSNTDYSSLNEVARKNLDDLAHSVILDDDARDELASLVSTSKEDIASRAIEIDKDGIETLSSDAIGFHFTQALINGDIASAEASLASYPSYFTEAKQIELSQFANTIRNSKDLLSEFSSVSGDMKTEALAIKSFQDRWREAGHILPSQAEIEMYQVSAKNATQAWDDELMTMLPPEDRKSNALVKLNMPTALKETLPEVVMRAANNVAYNAKQLIGFEFHDFGDMPQNAMMQKFKDNYDSIPDRMQVLAAMADYFTQSDGKGGYMPATTVENIKEMTDNDAEAKLFLDLMVAYRTLKALDPSLTKIR